MTFVQGFEPFETSPGEVGGLLYKVLHWEVSPQTPQSPTHTLLYSIFIEKVLLPYASH